MRPVSISVLSLILFVLAAPKFINAVYAVVMAPGGYPFFGLATSGSALLATYGLWRMRRWGVFLFVAVWLVQVTSLPLFPLDTARDELRIWFFAGLLVVFLAVVVPNWQAFQGARAGNPAPGDGES